VQALIKAAQAKDTQALLGLFGPLGKPIIESGDPVADKNSRDNFLANYKAKNSLDKSVADQATLNVGADEWPFPIPSVQMDGAWYFDSRGWGDLAQGTPLEWPVPYQEMDTRSEKLYNSSTAAAVGTYGY